MHSKGKGMGCGKNQENNKYVILGWLSTQIHGVENVTIALMVDHTTVSLVVFVQQLEFSGMGAGQTIVVFLLNKCSQFQQQ